MVSKWVGDVVPFFAGIRVALAAKYLGTFLEPLAGAAVWVEAPSKLFVRLLALIARAAPIALALREYFSGVQSVLGYLLQFYVLSAVLVRRERERERERERGRWRGREREREVLGPLVTSFPCRPFVGQFC